VRSDRLGVRVYELGFRVSTWGDFASRFLGHHEKMRVASLGVRVWSLGFGVGGLGFGVWGLGFGV
jgi:hypothetical protein